MAELAQRLKVADEEAMLVQFVNTKKKPVQIGFKAWLLEQDKEFLNQEVKIYWPKIDVSPARTMLRALKNLKNEDWEILVVKILSVGGKIYAIDFRCARFYVPNGGLGP